MNHYEIWCNLKDSRRDLDFCSAVRAYLGFLQRDGRIDSWQLTRRKLGFGPPELGEFHISVATRNLAQLDHAFDIVATRSGEVERLHAPVYSMITDFKSALYRDFPDPQRVESRT
jgi:hypothetical protein